MIRRAAHLGIAGFSAGLAVFALAAHTMSFRWNWSDPARMYGAGLSVHKHRLFLHVMTPPTGTLQMPKFSESGFTAGRMPSLPDECMGVPRGADTYYVGIPLWALVILFSAYPAIAFIRGPVRRRRRRRKGLCVQCGYDLTGNVTGVCSECGKPK